MKIISLLGEAEVGNKANISIDRDLLYKAKQKYPQYSGEQALTLYIADEMKEKDKVDSNQNRLIDTQKRENERLRSVVNDLGQTVEQEIQQVAQQAEINDREIERIKSLTGQLSKGGTDTERKAKVSGDDLEKLHQDFEMVKNKPGMDLEKVKKLEDEIKKAISNPSFGNQELEKLQNIVSVFKNTQSVSDDTYKKAFVQLQNTNAELAKTREELGKTSAELDRKEERFKNYIAKTGQTVRTSSEEIKKYSDIVNSYKSQIGDINKELNKMKSEKDIIYDLRAGIQQDAEDINNMKIDISQSLDFINQYVEKMSSTEPSTSNKKVADINWLVGGNQKPQNTPNTSHIQEGYDVIPSRQYNNSKYSEWITKHLPGLFSMFKGRYATELKEKGYSDKQISDTLEEYVPLLYNLGDDKTPLTPQQVKLWIDNVKKKLWERPAQYEMFNESLDKTYARMLDDIIGLAYIKKG
jgi:ABC-type transporter Mla subunit MlaD